MSCFNPVVRAAGFFLLSRYPWQAVEPRFAGGVWDKRPAAALNGPQSTGGDLLVGLDRLMPNRARTSLIGKARMPPRPSRSRLAIGGG